MAGALLHQALPCDTPVYITEPTWSNHRQVFEAVGFTDVRAFQWYEPSTGRLDLVAVLAALSQAPPQSVVVLHASAHNPSGCDPDDDGWRQIAAVLKARRLVPVMDAAYLGITSGSYDADAAAIRCFTDELGLETVVCASFAKNMGLYGERVGLVSVVARSATAARAVESKLAQLTRAQISNPPAFGARIAAAILADGELRAQWGRDLVTMSARIAGMRKALHEELVKLGTPSDWSRILEQKGMFCILGLSVEQVLRLRGMQLSGLQVPFIARLIGLLTASLGEYHIYMADSSRVSIAGLNESNVAYVAASLDKVVRASV